MRSDAAPIEVRRGRSGRPYRRLQAQVWAEETDCWLCGTYVDQTLPYTDRMSRSLDHVMPLARGGDPLARSNARMAHRKCNEERSTSQATPTHATRSPSRAWI